MEKLKYLIGIFFLLLVNVTARAEEVYAVSENIRDLDNRSLAKVNSRASNSPFQQLNSFLDQIVSVYFYTVLLISENI